MLVLPGFEAEPFGRVALGATLLRLADLLLDLCRLADQLEHEAEDALGSLLLFRQSLLLGAAFLPILQALAFELFGGGLIPRHRTSGRSPAPAMPDPRPGGIGPSLRP